jgi:hypothetical protein
MSVALEDLRDDPSPSTETIQARGITLNGRTFSPQLVQGPVDESPAYRILAGGLIQF